MRQYVVVCPGVVDVLDQVKHQTFHIAGPMPLVEAQVLKSAIDNNDEHFDAHIFEYELLEKFMTKKELARHA